MVRFRLHETGSSLTTVDGSAYMNQSHAKVAVIKEPESHQVRSVKSSQAYRYISLICGVCSGKVRLRLEIYRH